MANKYFEAKLNSKEVTDTLKRYAKEVGDLNPALRISRRMLLNAIDQNFETEGTSSGEKFKEWSDGYKAWCVAKVMRCSIFLRCTNNQLLTRNLA